MQGAAIRRNNDVIVMEQVTIPCSQPISESQLEETNSLGCLPLSFYAVGHVFCVLS